MNRERRRRLTTCAIAAAACAAAPAPAAAQQAAAEWLDPVSGDWTEPTKWSLGARPPGHFIDSTGYRDDVLIGATGPDYVVTLDREVGVVSLRLDSPNATLRLANQNVTLRAQNGIRIERGTLNLNGGRIMNVAVTGAAGTITSPPGTGGILYGVTLGVPLYFERAGSGGGGGGALGVTNDLTLSGSRARVTLANGASLIAGDFFHGSTTLGGAGEIHFTAGAGTSTEPARLRFSPGITHASGLITIGPDVTVRATGVDLLVGSTDITVLPRVTMHHRVVNNGTISMEAPGKQLTFAGIFTNNGVLRVADGGTLPLPVHERFINNGIIEVAPGGTLRLSGTVSDFAEGRLRRTGGDVHVTGTFSTQRIDAFQGGFRIGGIGHPLDPASYATLHDSRLTAIPAIDTLRVVGHTNFVNVTLDANADVAHGSHVTLENFTLNGRLRLGGGNSVRFLSDQTLAGAAEIVFDDAAGAVPSTMYGHALTLAPAVTVRTGTGSGIVGLPGADLVNHGVISAATAGHSITLDARDFTSDGVLRAASGATLSVEVRGEATLGAVAAEDDSMVFLKLSREPAHDNTASLVNRGGRMEIDGKLTATAVENAGVMVVHPDTPFTVAGPLENTGTIYLNGPMTVRATPPTRDATLRDVEAQVASARNSGGGARWTGKGITSIAAIGDALAALAVGLADDDVIVTYTYNGDANLDGRVNADDYFRIDQGFLAQPEDPTYAQGDFNYDDNVNADDYFLIDQAFLGQTGTLGGGLMAVAVPEPGTLALFVGAVLAPLTRPGRRRRRRRRCCCCCC